jgi:hypothetical protein
VVLETYLHGWKLEDTIRLQIHDPIYDAFFHGGIENLFAWMET